MNRDENSETEPTSTSQTAREAVRRGYQPIPISTRGKSPAITSWTQMRWSPDDPDVEKKFTAWAEDGMGNLGLLLGEPSGGLIDVDLDHPRTMRLKDYFLPPTPMRTGRMSRPSSHYWYQVEGETLPGNRRHKMPGGEVSVELRSTRSQTVIPPSVHPSGERYRWEAEPWGGEAGPAKVNGKVLAVQVASLALAAVLLDGWPRRGSRHDAYLALAGGLLRYGREGVHPYWERNVGVLIHALAEATHDEDGGDTRVAETVPTTISRLRSGEKLVAGFGRLGEIIGSKHLDQVRAMVREVERESGFLAAQEREPEAPSDAPTSPPLDVEVEEVDEEEEDSSTPQSPSWDAIDLEPYLRQEIEVRPPEIMARTDGMHLMYRGRVNMLYGSSETAKSWIALACCLQEMAQAGNVLYLDFEDEPENTLARLFSMDAGIDDIRKKFTYIRPEDPHEEMQRNRWGSPVSTDTGRRNREALVKVLSQVNPSLIVADGMTALYGLHGLDTNDASGTEVITGWLKRLTRNGLTTVIIIDHAPKTSAKGSLPIGSQHKQAMVQGTLLQVWPRKQPMPGQKGEIELYVIKDRPGLVRKVSEQSGDDGKVQLCSVITLDSTFEDGHTELTFGLPSGDNSPPPSTLSADLQNNRKAARDSLERRREQDVLDLFNERTDLYLTKKEMVEAMADLPAREVRAAVDRLYEGTAGIDYGKKYLGRRRRDTGKPGNSHEFYLTVGEK